MARSLQLGVVAEGVETKEPLAFLSRLRCDEYRGYYFGKPVPAFEFEMLLQQKRYPKTDAKGCLCKHIRLGSVTYPERVSD